MNLKHKMKDEVSLVYKMYYGFERNEFKLSTRYIILLVAASYWLDITLNSTQLCSNRA